MILSLWPLLVLIAIFILDMAELWFALPFQLPMRMIADVAIILIALTAAFRSGLFLFHLSAEKTTFSSLENKYTKDYIISTIAAIILLGAWLNLHASGNVVPQWLTYMIFPEKDPPPENALVKKWAPKVLDMNEDGKIILSEKKSVSFDVNNTGFAGSTTWINGEDAFLVIDRNNNGKIDQGREMVGTSNPLIPIEWIDDNRDGAINSKDFSFSNILLWFDKNQDGISQEDELKYFGKDMKALDSNGYNVRTSEKEYKFITTELMAVDAPSTKWAPLILDMNQDGRAGITKKDAVYFDASNINFSKATMWVKAEDAFLALDRNGDGRIDQGREIFGKEGPFAPIVWLDSDRDGTINDQDISFSKILVWSDKNQDGISQKEELRYLAKDMEASKIIKTPDGYSIHIPGNSYQLITAELAADDINTRFSGDISLNFSALFLPELRGYGKVPNLSIAMSQDPELLKAAAELAAIPVEKVFLDFKAYWDKFALLLYRQAGVYNLDPNSRGPFIDDARKLAYQETTFMSNFVRMNTNNPSPGISTGPDHMNNFDLLRSSSLARFFIQAGGSSLFDDPIIYDRLTDAIIFNGNGNYPALSSNGIRTLKEGAQNAKDKTAYWASALFLINQIRGSFEDMSAEEVALLDDAIKAGDPRLDWQKLSQNYVVFLPCTPCLSNRGSTAVSDGARKNAAPMGISKY